MMRFTLCVLVIFGSTSWALKDAFESASFKDQTSNSLMETGREVPANSLPYHVVVQADQSDEPCGGSLISRSYLLTSASCVANANFVKVLLGAHDIENSIPKPKTQTIVSRKITTHPEYDPTTYANNIAILRLSSRVKLRDTIQVINLASADSDSYENRSSLLTGYQGFSGSSRSTADTLQQIKLQIDSEANCKESFGDYVTNTTLCTSGTTNSGALVGGCTGETGAPLIASGVQVALVSIHDSNCAWGSPTVYTKISPYRDWIYKIAKV